MCDGVCHKVPQFSGKKPSPGFEPSAPMSYLPADSLKQPGESKDGKGVRSRKTRQSTGSKTMKVD